jgi:hypothetical protein
LPGKRRELKKFLTVSPHLAKRAIRYGRCFSGGIGFCPCYYPGRYIYGSAGYPDVAPFPVHIVAANADDVCKCPACTLCGDALVLFMV